jgi:acetyl esterase/lipase
MNGAARSKGSALAALLSVAVLGAALSAALAACGGSGGVSSSPFGGASGAASTPASAGTPSAGAVYRDLAYGADSPAQRLDLYLPPRGEAPYPIVVGIHGGGFMSGSKTDGQIAPVLEARKRGYAVVGLDYRLSPEARFPAAINDVKAAVRWLRAHADEYRLDASRIAVWGDSAGGNLAALAGTSGGVVALSGPHPTDAGRSDRVQAVVDWFGPVSFLRTDRGFRAAGFSRASVDEPGSFISQYLGAPPARVPAMVKAADPITYISPDDPPILIEHGTADGTVPVGQSVRLARAYAAEVGAGAVTLHLLKGAGHVDAAFYTQAHVDHVLDWLDAQLK